MVGSLHKLLLRSRQQHQSRSRLPGERHWGWAALADFIGLTRINVVASRFRYFEGHPAKRRRLPQYPPIPEEDVLSGTLPGRTVHRLLHLRQRLIDPGFARRIHGGHVLGLDADHRRPAAIQVDGDDKIRIDGRFVNRNPLPIACWEGYGLA